MSKKKIISAKEYANICLTCPYSYCHQTHNGCERTRPYKVIDINSKERKNKKNEEN